MRTSTFAIALLGLATLGLTACESTNVQANASDANDVQFTAGQGGQASVQIPNRDLSSNSDRPYALRGDTDSRIDNNRLDNDSRIQRAQDSTTGEYYLQHREMLGTNGR